jgi:hypothetical protein
MQILTFTKRWLTEKEKESIIKTIENNDIFSEKIKGIVLESIIKK